MLVIFLSAARFLADGARPNSTILTETTTAAAAAGQTLTTFVTHRSTIV